MLRHYQRTNTASAAGTGQNLDYQTLQLLQQRQQQQYQQYLEEQRRKQFLERQKQQQDLYNRLRLAAANPSSITPEERNILAVQARMQQRPRNDTGLRSQLLNEHGGANNSHSNNQIRTNHNHRKSSSVGVPSQNRSANSILAQTLNPSLRAPSNLNTNLQRNRNNSDKDVIME